MGIIKVILAILACILLIPVGIFIVAASYLIGYAFIGIAILVLVGYGIRELYLEWK